MSEMDAGRLLNEPLIVFGCKRIGAHELGSVPFLGPVRLQARLTEYRRTKDNTRLWIASNHAGIMSMTRQGLFLHEQGMQNLISFLEHPEEYQDHPSHGGYPSLKQTLPGATFGARGVIEHGTGIDLIASKGERKGESFVLLTMQLLKVSNNNSVILPWSIGQKLQDILQQQGK